MPRPPPEPKLTIAIASPIPSSTLTHPRVGSSEPVSVRVQQREWADIDYIWVRVSQPGISDFDVGMSLLGNRYQTDISFRRSGPATLRAYAQWTSTSTEEPGGGEARSESVSVTVAPTEQLQVAVTINEGVILEVLENGKNKATGGNGFPVAIVTDKQVAGITVQCIVDGQGLTPVSIPRVETSADSVRWYAGSAIVLAGTMAPRPFAGFSQPSLRVTYRDHFGVDASLEYPFVTADVTGPALTISQPTEDQRFVTASLPHSVRVSGTVRDIQSGYRDGSLRYYCSGATGPVPVANDGAWAFDFVAAAYGQYTLRMDARDKVPNVDGGNLTTPQVIRQFEVLSSVKPQNIEELLSPRAYLGELTRFISSHLVTGDGSTSVGPSLLQEKFFQDFGGLAQIDAALADRSVNDQLTPVQILRQVPSLESAGLIARYSFDESPADGPQGPWRQIRPGWPLCRRPSSGGEPRSSRRYRDRSGSLCHGRREYATARGRQGQ
ncbi:MAG: hypothetical protein JZU52_17055 [Lamprocystis purpurea]|nr:hypothetical protein [Lamprocystis purpurea]